MAEHELQGVIADKPENKRKHILTKNEKDICEAVIVNGIEYLSRTLQWDATSVGTFLSKAAVQQELEFLKRSYEDREGVQERTRFFAQLKLNSMVPAAITVLAKTMRGDTINNDTGDVDRAPTKAQFDAALQILNRANVKTDKSFAKVEGVPVTTDNPGANAAKQINENNSEEVSQKNVVTFLNDVIQQAYKRGNSELPLSRRRKPPKRTDTE